jgi:hypothetical protein
VSPLTQIGPGPRTRSQLAEVAISAPFVAYLERFRGLVADDHTSS